LFLYQNIDNQILTTMEAEKNIKELVTIGRKIKSFRALRGFTQEDLADTLQISKTAVQDIEKGKTDLNFSRLQEIAEKLEVSLIELIGIGEGDFLYVHKGIGMNHHEVTWNHNENESDVKFLKQEIEHLQEKNQLLTEQAEGLKKLVAFLENSKEIP